MGRRAWTVIIFLSGIAIMLGGLAIHSVNLAELASVFLVELGIVTFVVFGSHILHEFYMRKEATTDALEAAKKTLPDPDELQNKVLEAVSVTRSGLTLISKKRQHLPQYYDWLRRNTPDVVKIGGRSCLHRIEIDLNRQHVDAIIKIVDRLWDGAILQVVFHNPSSGLVKFLARDEHRPEREMLVDIARSIGICRKLHQEIQQRLDAGDEPAVKGSVVIKLSDAVPSYSFQSYDSIAIIGFYFPEKVGYMSGAWMASGAGFEIFSEGYEQLFDEARTLLSSDFDRGTVRFDEALYNRVRTYLLNARFEKGSEPFSENELEKYMPT